MKKLILPLLMASVVISAVSCQKEAALEPENTEKTPSGFVRWSFTADMPETKTTLDLDAGSVTWEAGDVITLYYLDGDNAPKSVEATTETGGANATFTADIPEDLCHGGIPGAFDIVGLLHVLEETLVLDLPGECHRGEQRPVPPEHSPTTAVKNSPSLAAGWTARSKVRTSWRPIPPLQPRVSPSSMPSASLPWHFRQVALLVTMKPTTPSRPSA